MVVDSEVCQAAASTLIDLAHDKLRGERSVPFGPSNVVDAILCEDNVANEQVASVTVVHDAAHEDCAMLVAVTSE